MPGAIVAAKATRPPHPKAIPAGSHKLAETIAAPAQAKAITGENSAATGVKTAENGVTGETTAVTRETTGATGAKTAATPVMTAAIIATMTQAAATGMAEAGRDGNPRRASVVNRRVPGHPWRPA